MKSAAHVDSKNNFFEKNFVKNIPDKNNLSHASAEQNISTTAVNFHADNLQRRAQPWLGTRVEIGVSVVKKNTPHTAECADKTAHAFAQAFAVCARIHAAMSPALPHSDIARFNAANAGDTVLCDAWTVRVLTLAEQVKAASDGLFDATQGSGEFRFINSTRVLKKNAAAQLNVGGIAKGFAVDKMVACLRAHGIKSGYVNAGGDLRVFGAQPWPVYIRASKKPNQQEPQIVQIQNGSVASSVFERGISIFQHDALIHPAQQTLHAISAGISIAAPRCVFADALTKVVALSGNIQHPALPLFNATAWRHEPVFL